MPHTRLMPRTMKTALFYKRGRLLPTSPFITKRGQLLPTSLFSTKGGRLLPTSLFSTKGGRLPAALGLIACLLTAVALTGCSNKSEESAESSFNAVAAPTEVYVVKGVVTALPIGEDPRATLRIHHEHIPDFKAKDGKVHMNPDGVPGMKAMEMPFDTLGPDVHLDGIQIGDKIEFELAIARKPRTSFAITRITKLPASTVIDYSNKVVADPEP